MILKKSINKEIIRLTIPNIISNITVPLLSMIDMSIVGHLSVEVYIGAIATATLIFNFIYMSFSFLRMGTSGFTAQAFGASDKPEILTVLLRSLLIAFLVGLILIVCQSIIFDTAFRLIKSAPEVREYAAEYFNIYIWGAPAVLGMYAFSGWFVGMQDARTPMYISISINVVNIHLSLFFVYILDMKIKGVALGSSIAQTFGFCLTFFIWFIKYKNIRIHFDLSQLQKIAGYIPFFQVNTNIFIRTMLLILVTTFFTSISARSGTTILAANALLMQLFTLFSYMMDGFAYAAEALTGRFVGERRKDLLDSLVRKLFGWGIAMAIFFTLLYAVFTSEILGLLTDKLDVIKTCLEYKDWVLLIPIAGFSAFLWDGIFVGATASKQMRNSMIISAISFFLIYYSLHTLLGNNALWLAFIIYLFMRGLVQAVFYRKIKQTLF